MSEEFNPYRVWLGIPKKYLPANHYRLLGLELFENDPDVIEAAADKQMSFIRTFQAGRHSAESQQILNEISAARICLLNADKKAQYDFQLRELEAKKSGMSGILPPPPPPPIPPVPPVPPASIPPAAPPSPPINNLPVPPLAKSALPVPPLAPPPLAPPLAHRNEESGSRIGKTGKESRKNVAGQTSESDSDNPEKEAPNFDFLNQPQRVFSGSCYQTIETNPGGTSSTTSQEILLADNLPGSGNESQTETSPRGRVRRKAGRKRRIALGIFGVLIVAAAVLSASVFIPQKFVPKSLVPVQEKMKNAVLYVLPKSWSDSKENAPGEE